MRRNSVIVTGVSSGDGQETALKLIADGKVVYGVARRVERMQDLASAGGPALRVDLTDRRLAPRPGFAGGYRARRLCPASNALGAAPTSLGSGLKWTRPLKRTRPLQRCPARIGTPCFRAVAEGSSLVASRQVVPSDPDCGRYHKAAYPSVTRQLTRMAVLGVWRRGCIEKCQTVRCQGPLLVTDERRARALRTCGCRGETAGGTAAPSAAAPHFQRSSQL